MSSGDKNNGQQCERGVTHLPETMRFQIQRISNHITDSEVCHNLNTSIVHDVYVNVPGIRLSNFRGRDLQGIDVLIYVIGLIFHSILQEFDTCSSSVSYQ